MLGVVSFLFVSTSFGASVTFIEVDGGYQMHGTYINEASINNNYGGASRIHADADAGDIEETLLMFPDIFGSGTEQVPVGSSIILAQLVVHTASDSTSHRSLNVHNVHMVTVSWDESVVTWDNFGGGIGNDGGAAGTHWNSTIAASFVPYPHNTTFSVDVTSVVQEWASGTPNYGFIILNTGLDEFGDPYDDLARFRSDDNLWDATRPHLIVTYGSTIPEPASLILVLLANVAGYIRCKKS